MEGTVTQHFTYLHGIPQNAEKQIIDSLRAHKNSRNKNIDEISTQLKEHEERLQSAIVVRIHFYLKFLFLYYVFKRILVNSLI